ncbi:hypothetical protein M409DRAFT_27971 [Zasmidium cellare ATCC 36951]|uniref:Uncharacterized protein n=1 Tax=Zasmidium cellare ATCC 36951 TaxID=1080233 RepID=A0A6A6C840_ZASCE|nr:uncharacterized protein M409DRAFT_27971 [Zasmidium cellare ATCC 36951]KAF2161576.1 hypothetical protein M409DRAFT_27971 [Zasmidium cellare ATCC 36951]
MAVKRRKTGFLDLPPELRVMIYEYYFAKVRLKYTMDVRLEHSRSFAPQWRLDQRRRSAPRTPAHKQESSFASMVFYKEPLLHSCPAVHYEALPLYVARLEQINQEVEEKYHKAVELLERFGAGEEIPRRMGFCKAELDRVRYATMLLREAAV